MKKILGAAFLLGCCHMAMSEPVPIESGTVTGDIPIFYQVHGSSDGQPLLFIHPFGMYFDEARFRWIVDFFGDYRFIAIDVRGHGRSGKPAEPSAYGLNLIDDVNRLLEHLDLPDVHIIGVSMGAIVGLKYASLHPERVRSLTIVGQGLVPPGSFQEWVQMGITVAASSERTKEQEENLNLYTGFLQGYPPLLVSEEKAGTLALPLLVVIGEEDERLDRARRMKALYPATNLIVAPGYDHSTIMNPGSPFYLAIEGFLSRYTNSQSAPR